MKKSILIVAVGVAIGYVLGARAGRERYDLIVEKVTGVWEDPRVAKARREAAHYAREQAPVIRDRAQAVAKDIADKGVTTARRVADRTASAATSVTSAAAEKAGNVAAKAGGLRDSLLEDDVDR